MLAEEEVDLHGYHPDDICGSPLAHIVEQAWEMGAGSIRLIHGHGHDRFRSPGFVHSNTGYLGISIRRALRHEVGMRQWIKHSTLDCSQDGSTVVKLKRNPSPTRTEF